ncbi:MAG TPA: SBBP repeat-containing protein [Methylomirabilota bacterium]|nr:SBBP repeat-containing protein [Methylomirabilota bacterium]
MRGTCLAAGLAVAVLAAPAAGIAGPPLPVVFEANRGQADARVKFLSRGRGYTLFVTQSGVILADRRAGQTVQLRLLGSHQDPEIVGLRPLPGRTHYFLGRNPANWRTNVPTFDGVVYRNAYSGIDAIYRAHAGSRIEQEFVIRPGADPGAIALGFEGIRDVVVDGAGELVLTTEGPALRLSRPVAYQVIDGTRREVPVAWIVGGPGHAGFALGPHDRSHPLVIDPLIAWATHLGGGGDDQAFGVAVDVVGNVYVTGDTTSLDFPEIGTSALAGGVDAFVSKLDANGQVLLYSAYIGGTGTDGGRAIDVDANNNAYLAGFTDSADFPTTAAGFQALPQGEFDAFVIKLDPNGVIAYSTFLGGSGVDTAFGIAVDGNGRAHVAGGTRSIDFPIASALQALPGGGTCGTPPVDCRDAFVTRLSALGNVLEYSTFLGGSNDDNANAIALDGNGRVYVTGFTLSGDFPTTPGSFRPVPSAGLDAFVARVNADGSLGWSTYLGGVGADIGNGIAVNAAGSPHVVGSTTSTNFPATGGDVFTGLTEGFAVRLDATGSLIVWSRSTGSAVPAAVALDTVGDVQLVANDLVCTDPLLTPPGCPQSHVDVVVNKRSGVNGVSLDVIRFGGTGNLAAGQDFGQAITATLGSVWVAGFTLAANFPATPGAFQTTNQGGADAFVVKLVDLFAAVPVEGDDDDCVIATAAFGSRLAAEVRTLRRFRDEALRTNPVGRLLVRAYYKLSPPFARAVRNEPVLAAAVRSVLRPVAHGAGFVLDRPVIAVALAAVGIVAIVGLGVSAATRSTRIRTTMIGLALAGGVLIASALILGRTGGPPPPGPRSSSAREPVVGRGAHDVAPGVTRPVDRRPATAGPLTADPQPGIRDLAALAGDGPSVTLLNPLAPRSARRWRVTSDLIEGVLSAEGFAVTDPRLAGRLGIQAGDMIVRIDDHPPTGLLAVLMPLQRDPDRATVVVEIDRAGNRLVQSYRVR